MTGVQTCALPIYPLKPQKLLDLSRAHKTASGEPYRIRRTLEFGRIPVAADTLFATA